MSVVSLLGFSHQERSEAPDHRGEGWRDPMTTEGRAGETPGPRRGGLERPQDHGGGVLERPHDYRGEGWRDPKTTEQRGEETDP